jgi:trans-aconitate methyltransferase
MHSHIFPRNIGYVLHPETIAQLTPESRVADIGTGTGIFLEQLHVHHPETTLDGFDISTALFPAQSTLPSQISLRQLDIKQPIPQELQGQYDVVHVQMLAAGMLPSEWELVVRNVVLLLKPGGWLQWTECDFLGVKHLSGHPRATVETARRMGRAFRDALKERFGHGWNSLPVDMEAAGLASIRTDLLSSDRIPETREKMTANGMQAILSWARRMAEPGTMTLEELNKAEAQAYEDIRSGCYVRFDVYVTRGRKVHTTG